MEARVMSWERIRIVLQEQDKKGVTDNMLRLEAIAEAQAEITWDKAIKEVVEWINEHSVGITSGNELKDNPLWQAKLKEWGE